MRTRLPLLLLAVFLAVFPAGLLAGPAAAQAPAAAPAVRTEVLAPGQAREALEVLRDEKRRNEMISTLEAIAAASPALPNAGPPSAGVPSVGAPSVGAPAAVPSSASPAATAAPAFVGPAGVAVEVPPAAQPVTKLPLEPDSLAAQLISQASTALSDSGERLVASLHEVNDLPLLWRWVVAQADDPDKRALLLDAFWKLLVVMGAALGLEWATVLLLRRVRALLARQAQTRPAPPPPPDMPDVASEGDDLAAGQDERARSARARRLTGALGALRRLPYLLGRLLLDLVPIIAFALLANFLLGTRLGVPASARGAILVAVQSYVAARLVLVLTALLVSPVSPGLRLLHISDWAAAFLTRWVRRLTVVALTGNAVAGIGLQFEMYRTAYDTLLKLFALVVHLCAVAAILQARVPVARRIQARHGTSGVWSVFLNRLSRSWHLVAIFYVMALWLVWAVELRNGYVRLLHFFLVTAGVTICSRLVAIVLLGGLDKARVLPGLAARLPGFEARAGFYYPLLRSFVMGVIGVATGLALLEVWGFSVIEWSEQSGLGGRTLSAVLLIAFTVFLAVVVWEGANAGIELHLSRLTQGAQMARAGRLRTLLPMLRTALFVTIVLIVLLTTLDELGVNIAPLLAGAGVVGIAVGFGSQKLVQDLITGLFLLLENAMQVGDVVTLGGLTGTVEALSIRTIRLRALDGAVHIIPFSAVTTVTNQTRDYSYAVVDVSIGLNEEPDRIAKVLKHAAEAMRKEDRWADIVLEPLDIMGVEKFIDLAWVLRVRIKTQPASRWAVTRELNRRIKTTFDQLGIESPFTSHRALSATPGPPEEASHEQLDRSAAE